jgi:hypothetical protein
MFFRLRLSPTFWLMGYVTGGTRYNNNFPLLLHRKSRILLWCLLCRVSEASCFDAICLGRFHKNAAMFCKSDRKKCFQFCERVTRIADLIQLWMCARLQAWVIRSVCSRWRLQLYVGEGRNTTAFLLSTWMVDPGLRNRWVLQDRTCDSRVCVSCWTVSPLCHSPVPSHARQSFHTAAGR